MAPIAQANRGKCRVTEQACVKGMARVVVPTGPSKFFATLPAAADMLAGLLKVTQQGARSRSCDVDVVCQSLLRYILCVSAFTWVVQ